MVQEASDESSFEQGLDDELTVNPGTGRNEVLEVENLARSETRQVKVWRILVVIIILVAGAIVSTGTYMFLLDEQQDQYTSSFYQFANSTRDAVEFHVDSLLQASRGMSEILTAEAEASNQTFPYVTVPTFEIHGEHTRVQSGAELISFLPHVTNTSEWISYSVANQWWIDSSRRIDKNRRDGTLTANVYKNSSIPPFVWTVGSSGFQPVDGDSLFPIWQSSPPPFDPALSINFDLTGVVQGEQSIGAKSFGVVLELAQLTGTFVSPTEHGAYHAEFLAHGTIKNDTYYNPHSVFVQPVFSKLKDDTSDVVGYLILVVAWDRYMADLLPDGVNGFSIVLVNTCGQKFTYTINGNRGVYEGKGDLHDTAFDQMEYVIPINDEDMSLEGCKYSLHVYPTAVFQQSYNSTVPILFTVLVAGIFFVMAVAFFIYDKQVQRRNTKVIGAAAKSNAIVSNLFPSNVRDRLFDEASTGQLRKNHKRKENLKEFLNSQGEVDLEIGNDDFIYKSKPIADLFPEVTVFFGDIVGFTAWSSTREPSQVFTLLETLYRAFDDIAKKRRIFKVETIGDCYVAVSGLPDPRHDHALQMARFSRDCMYKMRDLTSKLEVILGPDTSDLSMRMGLHSGPVTAGVLRGERSRFQLFGDTMNTAARMESTGLPDRIHLSQETADRLVSHGKESWIRLREEKIIAKGKGELQTYWLELSEGSRREGLSTNEDPSSVDPSEIDGKRLAETDIYMSEKTSRLIDWQTEILGRLLKQVVARREVYAPKLKDKLPHQTSPSSVPKGRVIVIDEVQEIIALPTFDLTAAKKQRDPEKVQLGEIVENQLREYVSNIASMHRDNPFHNYEHAVHVSNSVVKLLSRIVAPSEIDVKIDSSGGTKKEGSTLHDHTYGITSDPLTQFACVFSALIHDVDHRGVSNAQLVKEQAKLALVYKNKSVAEQNAVDLAWTLLMDPRFKELYETICATRDEKRRFRQLVVNAVMATDIVDKELKMLRNLRWDRAFSEAMTSDNTQDDVNRKATIVIEHLIQASDVAHTMQHWHVYRKWNECFFRECYKAYLDGRADSDPSEKWYEGELGFFDFYIIPLAKKLKDCGVFGVSSDEYLNYAIKNRSEWEIRGKDVVSEMKRKCLEEVANENAKQVESSRREVKCYPSI